MTEPSLGPCVLAVTSGKGGVGKTNLAVNLALSLRLFDVQVLLLDADLGLANVDVLLNLGVLHGLRDVVLKGWPIENIVVEGPRGLRILPGASGVEEMARLGDGELAGFLQQLQDYCAQMDYLVVDTAPGISPGVIQCLLAADQTLLVTNSEPTALTDAYALLKVLNNRARGRQCRVSVIMNETGSKEEALRSFDRLRNAARRFLDMDIEYLGSVARDEIVSEATKRQVAFLTHYAGSPCSRDVRKIAARLISAGRGGRPDAGRFFQSLAGVSGE
jgi:flagellar biosynthesis protein FlhG